MIKRHMGKAGPVSNVGIGTWNMERGDRQNAIRAIQASIDVGANHVDTAEMYGSGEVERIVGEAIRGRRGEVFLVSKVLPSHAKKPDVIAACEASLARLGTDHLDVYLLHWRGEVPLEETIDAFETLVESGKIKHYGVSNFDPDDMKEVVSIAGPGRVVCNQVLYHLRERTIEHALIPWCKANDVAVVAYSPFGSGRFPTGAPRQVLDTIARAHEATAHQVALAFLNREDAVLSIPKSSNAGRAVENAEASDVVLSADEIEAIDRAFPVGAWRGLPLL